MASLNIPFRLLRIPSSRFSYRLRSSACIPAHPLLNQHTTRNHATAVPEDLPPNTPVPKLDTLGPAPSRKWSREEIQEVYDTPLMELVFRSVSFYRHYIFSSA